MKSSCNIVKECRGLLPFLSTWINNSAPDKPFLLKFASKTIYVDIWPFLQSRCKFLLIGQQVKKNCVTICTNEDRSCLELSPW